MNPYLTHHLLVRPTARQLEIARITRDLEISRRAARPSLLTRLRPDPR